MRDCLACDAKDTKIGVLFVHGNTEEEQRGNHYVCHLCANECLANLPPTCICLVCYRVPHSKSHSTLP